MVVWIEIILLIDEVGLVWVTTCVVVWIEIYKVQWKMIIL